MTYFVHFEWGQACLLDHKCGFEQFDTEAEAMQFCQALVMHHGKEVGFYVLMVAGEALASFSGDGETVQAGYRETPVRVGRGS